MTPEQLRKLDLWKPGLTIVAIIFCLLWLRSCEDKKNADLSAEVKISKLEDEVSVHEAKSARSDSTLHASRAKWVSDSLSMVSREGAFKTELNRLSGDVAELKAKRDSSGVVMDPITVEIEQKTDSLIQAQAAEIAALNQDKGVMSKRYEVDTKALIDKIEAKDAIIEVWRTAAVEATDDAERYKKQRNTSRIAAGVLGAVVALWVIDKVKD